MLNEENIKLIFGLKMSQIRNDKDLSLFGLAKLTGLSKSYLNEIEKGKKYPKTDKIALIANALDVDYDELVSLKLTKNLAPIGDILQSGMLKEIPLEHFGIQQNDLIDIMANAPLKVSAFISTLIEIATHHNLTKENFYLAALRSLQESQNNYFDEVEKKASKFRKFYSIPERKVPSKYLQEILQEEYEYEIITNQLSKHKELKNIRSLYINENPKKLLISNDIDEKQKAFILAKEIGFNHLNIKDRPSTFTWIKFDSFDQVYNNFLASYFAGALIIGKETLIKKFNHFLKKKNWNTQSFDNIINSFNCSHETFFQRLTNILPKHLNISNLFFLRFNTALNSNSFYLTKELHLSQLHNPRANENNQHYCRRWVGIDILKRSVQKNKSNIRVQLSNYIDSKNKYLVITSANNDPFKHKENRSIAIGLLINNSIEKKINFLEDNNILRKTVGVTCESCSLENCKERVAKPIIVEENKKDLRVEKIINHIILSFSKNN